MKPWFTRLFVLALAFVCCVPAFATTIVIVRTANLIVIASDSKVQYQGAQGLPQGCKVARQNETYYVVAGLAMDTYHGFLAGRTIASAIARSNTFDEQVKAVEEDLQRDLQKELDALKVDGPEAFKFAVTGDTPSSVGIVTIEAGVPKVAVFSFILDETTGKITVQRDTCPGTCTSDSYYVQLGGVITKEEAEKVQGAPLYIARTLVEKQIARDPKNVGPPIEILELRASGPEWIQDDLNCAAEMNIRKKYPKTVTVQF
jgi:hypothetical protein